MGCASSVLDVGSSPHSASGSQHGSSGGAVAVKPQTAHATGSAMAPQKQYANTQQAATRKGPLAAVQAAEAARAAAARSPVQSRSALRLREARILHEKLEDSDAANEKSLGVRFPRIAGASGNGTHLHGARASHSDEQLLQLREHERAQLEGEAQGGDSSPSKKSATARRGSRGSAHRLPHLSPTVGSGSAQTPRGFFSATTRTHGLEDCGSDHSVAGTDGGMASGLTSGIGVPSSNAHGGDGPSRRGSNFTTATFSAKANPAAFPSFATSVSGEHQHQTMATQQLQRQASKTSSKLTIEVRTPLQQQHDAIVAHATPAGPIIGGSTTASAFTKRTPESKTMTASGHKKELAHLLPQTSTPREGERPTSSSTDEKKRPQLQVSIDSCAAAVPPTAPPSRTAAATTTAAAAAAAAVAAATPHQSGGGDAIPIQDAASYARQYSMYSDASPEYREYKAAWEAEQARLKAERQALKGTSHLRSRSIYSPEPSDRSSGASPMLTGVVSPVPGAMSPTGEEGGFFVARGTALCMMFESSRPASVCASPVPNYALVRAPAVAPLSPSSYALGGGDKTMTDLARLGAGFNNAAPGSPNPLSPPISQRERLFYAPAGGGQEIVESSPTINAVGAGSNGTVVVRRHSRTQSNVQTAAMTAAQVQQQQQRGAPPTAGSVAHSHRRVASQPNDLAVPIAMMPQTLQQQQQQQQSQQPSVGLQAPAPGSASGHAHGHGLDWMRVESRLHRLAEETDAEAHTHRREQSAATGAVVASAPTSVAAPPAAAAPQSLPASSVSVRSLQQSHRSMPSASGPVSVVRGDDTRRAVGGETTVASVAAAPSSDVMRIQVS